MIYIIFYCHFCHSLFAVVPAFNHLGSEEGLNNESIKAIVQDHEGYMWVGTISGLFNYDGYHFNRVVLKKNLENIRILSLFVDSQGKIWIGTQNNGLFRYDKKVNSAISIQSPYAAPYRVNDIIEDRDKRLWLGSDQGLGVIDLPQSFTGSMSVTVNYLPTMTISALSFIDQKLVIGSLNSLLLFNGVNAEFAEIYRFSKQQHIHKFHFDVNKKLWIGTSQGLIKFDIENAKVIDTFGLDIKTRVLSMVSQGPYLWVASLFNGLYRINISDHSYEQFTYQRQYKYSLSDNDITNLYISADQVLWVGTFSSGLNKLYLNTLDFGFETNISGSFDCAKNHKVYAINKDDNILWLGTGAGLVAFDSTQKACELFAVSSNEQINTGRIYHIWIEDETLWLSTSSGLKQFNKLTKELVNIDQLSSATTMFSFRHTDGFIYVATIDGLWKYSEVSNSILSVASSDEKFSTAAFHAYARDSKGQLYFATSYGLAHLVDGKLYKSDRVPEKFDDLPLRSIFSSHTDTLYLGYDSQGLLKIDSENNITHVNSDHLLLKGMTIKSMVADDYQQTLWMGSDRGLLKYNMNQDKYRLYTSTDGINGDSFLIGSAHTDDSGQLYLGHSQGYVAFNPQNIRTAKPPEYLTLTGFYLLNEKFDMSQSNESGLSLTKSINSLSHLQLNHKQNMIGFEFSSMQYQDPKKNQFAYRIEGLSDQWHHIGYDQRHLTFTNLNSGDYQLQIKAANKDGLWSDQIKTLNITVLPAPWKSPLAYFIYAICFIGAVVSLIHLRTASTKKRAKQLEAEIIKRTQEVKIQKQMLESMLNHKNQLYANITHEFRTPLALISGPVDQILNRVEAKPLNQELQMVKRNADRLLLMVDQLLNLSEAEHKQLINKSVQAVKPGLNMLYAAFLPLAEDKNIEFNCGPIHDCNVLMTSQCLEIVVGNLLSNAIKYTQIGGQIDLFTELKERKVNIIVKDNGPGIDAQNQGLIFDRFTRLHDEQIQGSGIGLAVVKEIVNINGGSVHVKSLKGHGSTFIASFNCTDDHAQFLQSHQLIEQLIDNSQAPVTKIETQKNNTNSKKPLVLVIEDNKDMQLHIDHILSRKFKCLFADEGKHGVAMCLKKVPDIVISDVMMPGMNGFQVARTIRKDHRTSHIPIVLLTALNSRESRMRGWRENVDAIVGKPFDASELVMQLENTLNIRQLLQQKASTYIKDNKDLSTIDFAEHDKKFINKLTKVIANHYIDNRFYKPQMAQAMAVSERQLNRKTKALLGQSPMEMLREYRLTSAAEQLSTGIQVSLVSDACGFNDVSYFASCFKRRYGITPKKYQLLHMQKS